MTLPALHAALPRLRVCRLLTGLLLLGLSGVAAAQTYPARPIRLIVPAAPGGGTDYTARFIGQKLTDAWGQPVIIDNRSGGSGNIGLETAAKSLPDGYTLVIPITSFPINPALYAKLPFDTVRDFAPVVYCAGAPLVLVVHPSLPVQSVKDLIALAKAKPGTLNYANSGAGTSAHLAGELFKRQAGVDIVSIAYKGGGPAVVDLIAGNVQLYFSTVPAATAQMKAGRLRGIAVSSTARVPDLPELPTIGESGLPGFDVTGWFGLFAPAGTPRAIVNQLNAEVAKALASPDARSKFAVHGLVPGGGTPEELGRFLGAEIAKWTRLVRDAGIRVE